MSLREPGWSNSSECDEFLARHGEYLDGTLAPLHDARLRLHAARCTTCARYDRVVRQGIDLVRDLPAVEPSPDFEQRLQHRIYHLDDAGALAGRPSVSATGTLALAAVMALLAWSPLLVGQRDAGAVAVDPAARGAAVFDSPAAAAVGLSVFDAAPGWSATSRWGAAPLSVPAHTPYAVTLAASLPGPYSPLIVTPPVHRTARAVSAEHAPVE
jgi:hypothetical protein